MARTPFLEDKNIIAGVNADGEIIPFETEDGLLPVKLVDGTTASNLSTLKHRVYTPVVAGDIGADYASGSEGMIKSIKEYDMGATAGSPAILTTYKYQNTTYPTFITDEQETATTV